MQASAPTEVCHNAWPRPSRSAQNIKFIRRGGIHPARNPRAAANPRGRAMALPYKPPAGARQNFCAAPKIRTEQAPLSKGAGCGQSPQTGGLPRPQMQPPGAPPKRALPSVNGISRRSNPSVLASLGHLPLTREAKTVPAAARFAGRCKHRPLQRFVIAHGRGHHGRPQHRRGCAAPAVFCRIILPFRRAACYNRQKPPHKTHQGGRRWN